MSGTVLAAGEVVESLKESSGKTGMPWREGEVGAEKEKMKGT